MRGPKQGHETPEAKKWSLCPRLFQKTFTHKHLPCLWEEILITSAQPGPRLLQSASRQPPAAPSAADWTAPRLRDGTHSSAEEGWETDRTALSWSCFLYKLTVSMVRKKFSFLAGIRYEYPSFTSNGQWLWEQRYAFDSLNPLLVLCQHKRQPAGTCGKESTGALTRARGSEAAKESQCSGTPATATESGQSHTLLKGQGAGWHHSSHWLSPPRRNRHGARHS